MRATYFGKRRRLSPKKKMTFLHGKSDFWHQLQVARDIYEATWSELENDR
jgi:hypothetical protein